LVFDVGVRQPQALGGELVDAGRGRPENAVILRRRDTIADIVGEDEDDVRLSRHVRTLASSIGVAAAIRRFTQNWYGVATGMLATTNMAVAKTTIMATPATDLPQTSVAPLAQWTEADCRGQFASTARVRGRRIIVLPSPIVRGSRAGGRVGRRLPR